MEEIELWQMPLMVNLMQNIKIMSQIQDKNLFISHITYAG